MIMTPRISYNNNKFFGIEIIEYNQHIEMTQVARNSEYETCALVCDTGYQLNEDEMTTCQLKLTID